ncbi:MAG: hypothetical protein MK086_11845, partial [Flavobacteriales bacterium]|nr:hypothetical protein [Flavobacteriales bacterium]
FTLEYGAGYFKRFNCSSMASWAFLYPQKSDSSQAKIAEFSVTDIDVASKTKSPAFLHTNKNRVK